MNTADFIQLLQQPQQISEEQTIQLQQLIEEFPYLQSARALYLKGLKNQESFTYNQELKTTAAYTTDRSVLFDFITSEAFNQNEISKIIKQNYEHLRNITVNEADDISVERSVTIDDALKEHIKSTEGVLDPDLFEKKVNIDEVANFLSLTEQTPEQVIIDIDAKNIEKTPEERLQIGKPLEFNTHETHSFIEWLKITNFKPINREEEPNLVTEKNQDNSIDDKEQDSSTYRNSKFELIDKFLEQNPKIVPSKDSPKINIETEDKIAHDGLMTETLARIYLEQNNYEKAIQSYKILSLKYPEKSGFFADQIKAVKEIQENNTNKP